LSTALIIYKLKNKINDKIYIGQTIKKLSERISGHIKSDSYVGRAIRKYGLESFDISIVDIAEDKNTLNEKEKYWIKFYDCKLPNGYNLASGGDGGNLSKFITYKPRTEEVKNKIRKKLIGLHPSKETIEKLKGRTPWNKNKKLSADHIMKLSASHKGKVSNNKGKKFEYKKRKPRPDMIGENNPAKRVEVRKKLSDNNAMKNPEVRSRCKGNLGKRYEYKPRPKAVGREITIETKRKLSEATTNYWKKKKGGV
jgi:group I intron endonuclease